MRLVYCKIAKQLVKIYSIEEGGGEIKKAKTKNNQNNVCILYNVTFLGKCEDIEKAHKETKHR